MPTVAGSLVGYWYGHGFQPEIQETAQFISHMDETGGFQIEFRVYKGCRLEFVQRESGTWTEPVKGTVQIVTNKIEEDNVSPITDDYETLELTDNTYRCRHIQQAVDYDSHRVDKDFKFPDCNTISLSTYGATPAAKFNVSLNDGNTGAG